MKAFLLKLLRIVLHYLPVLAIIFAILYFFNLKLSFSGLNYHPGLIVLSVLIMGLLFALRAFVWQQILKKYKIHVSYKVSVYSIFKTILTKYIPGKVWMILSKASIISQTGASLKLCSGVSLMHQLVSTFTGLTVGFFGLVIFKFDLIPDIYVYIILAVLLITLGLFSVGFKIPDINLAIWKKYRDKTRGYVPPLFSVVGLNIVGWLILGFGYLIFIQGIGFPIGFRPLLLQPLANNIGVVALFAPSGLGVREAIMAGYLALAGIDVGNASVIAIAARLWFFVIEVGIFAIGIVLQKFVDITAITSLKDLPVSLN